MTEERPLKHRLVGYGMSALTYASIINNLDNPKGILLGGALGTILLARELYRDRHTIGSSVNQLSSKITNPVKEIFSKRNIDYIFAMGY